MYNIKELLGKVVTVKFDNGIEVIAGLGHYDEEKEIITLSNPRIVVINAEELALLPYAFTGKTEQVFISLDSVQSVLETLESSANDYEAIIEGKEDK